MSLGPSQSPVQGRAAQSVVGDGLHVCLRIAGLAIRGLRHRRLCPAHCALAEKHSMRTDFVLDALEQALYDRWAQRDGAQIHRSATGRNMPPFATASGRPRQESTPQWVAVATAMTMLWSRRSTAYTRPN